MSKALLLANRAGDDDEVPVGVVVVKEWVVALRAGETVDFMTTPATIEWE